MQYDVVTVGGGFSGLVSACRAAELGLKAAVVEARSEQRYPCSSRYSTGVINVMGLPVLSEPDMLYQAILDGSGANVNPALARVLVDNAARAINWLMQQGASFATRGLRKDLPNQRVLAPPRGVVAGLDWDGSGPDVLMQRLELLLNERGGTLMRGTRVTSFVVEDGAVVAVTVERDGKPQQIGARAVVVADGGFAANKEMIAQYITPHADRLLARVGPEAKGDGMRMAAQAGAALAGLGEFYGHVHHRDAMSNPRLWPYPHLDAVGEIAILVGPDGRRFTDEGLGGVCQANGIARLADPLSVFLIMDEAMWRMEPTITTTVPANPIMVEAGGMLVSADDLGTLAERVGLPAAALAQTVREHNDAVARDDFSALAVPRTVKKH
jgi:fumarate reductase flavoprotein subunit